MVMLPFFSTRASLCRLKDGSFPNGHPTSNLCQSCAFCFALLETLTPSYARWVHMVQVISLTKDNRPEIVK